MATFLNGNINGWGLGLYGEITNIPNIEAVKIVMADDVILALASDGSLHTWGRTGSSTYDALQAIPTGAEDIIDISASIFSFFAVKSDGTVFGWGSAAYGQLDNVPTGATNIVALASGREHTLGLNADGTVVAWGSTTYGKTTVPVGLTNVIDIAAGQNHSVALKDDGTVVAWGDNTYGQTNTSGFTGINAIAASGRYTGVVKSDGTVEAIGYSTSTYTITTTEPTDTDFVDIKISATGEGFALKESGIISTWGRSTPTAIMTATPIDGGYTAVFPDSNTGQVAFAIQYSAGGGGSLSTRAAYDLEAFQSNMNRLAGLDGSYSAQYAANVWAGTVDEPILNALNIIAGTQGLGMRAVVNLIAGTDNLGIDEALRRIP